MFKPLNLKPSTALEADNPEDFYAHVLFQYAYIRVRMKEMKPLIAESEASKYEDEESDEYKEYKKMCNTYESLKKFKKSSAY